MADDDAEDRELFADALQRLAPDASLISVRDGAEAIAYLEKNKGGSIPDLVILDYNMPHVNGPQVLDWLCAREVFNGIAKFVWSTAAQREYIDDCKAKGALQYFVKPNSEAQLMSTVSQILATVRTQPENKA